MRELEEARALIRDGFARREGESNVPVLDGSAVVREGVGDGRNYRQRSSGRSLHGRANRSRLRWSETAILKIQRASVIRCVTYVPGSSTAMNRIIVVF